MKARLIALVARRSRPWWQTAGYLAIAGPATLSALWFSAVAMTSGPPHMSREVILGLGSMTVGLIALYGAITTLIRASR